MVNVPAISSKDVVTGLWKRRIGVASRHGRSVFQVKQMLDRERDFVRIGRAPRNNAFELYRVILNGADLDEFGFDHLDVSHNGFSMAQEG